MNARMPELKLAFEAAGFTQVRTVLASGNVAFDARRASDPTLQRAAEAAIRERLGRSFLTIVRSMDRLRELLESDPFGEFGPPRPAEKRIVTFLREEPKTKISLPLEQDGARLLALRGRELYSTYVPTPKGAVFMTLIERTFGREVTTRTWDTVARVARA